jgi:hypothetical protein
MGLKKTIVLPFLSLQRSFPSATGQLSVATAHDGDGAIVVCPCALLGLDVGLAGIDVGHSSARPTCHALARRHLQRSRRRDRAAPSRARPQAYAGSACICCFMSALSSDALHRSARSEKRERDDHALPNKRAPGAMVLTFQNRKTRAALARRPSGSRLSGAPHHVAPCASTKSSASPAGGGYIARRAWSLAPVTLPSGGSR